MQQADSTRYEPFPPESIARIREENSYERVGESFDIFVLINRIWRWIIEKLGLSNITIPGFEMSFDFLFWIMLLIVAAVVVYLILNARYPGLISAARFGEAIMNPFSNGGGPHVRPDPNALLESGDYRNAVRLLHIDTIIQLDKKGIVRHHPNKTNAEYVREIRDASVRKWFGSLSGLYVYAWFGGFSPQRNQLEEAIVLWERLTGGPDKTDEEAGA
ncbi:MAG: DUF4129 domain-containing protein [Balneolia bacterium]|nr:DUF4129 domain-containing protein [Balneolia bacterium]